MHLENSTDFTSQQNIFKAVYLKRLKCEMINPKLRDSQKSFDWIIYAILCTPLCVHSCTLYGGIYDLMMELSCLDHLCSLLLLESSSLNFTCMFARPQYCQHVHPVCLQTVVLGYDITEKCYQIKGQFMAVIQNCSGPQGKSESKRSVHQASIQQNTAW